MPAMMPLEFSTADPECGEARVVGSRARAATVHWQARSRGHWLTVALAPSTPTVTVRGAGPGLLANLDCHGFAVSEPPVESMSVDV